MLATTYYAYMPISRTRSTWLHRCQAWAQQAVAQQPFSSARGGLAKSVSLGHAWRDAHTLALRLATLSRSRGGSLRLDRRRGDVDVAC
ncbi:hypothetical protein M3J09_006170 [Ascochyta lentis]